MADAGIFPVLSRVNHACVANAEAVWKESHGVKELRATSKISVIMILQNFSMFMLA